MNPQNQLTQKERWLVKMKKIMLSVLVSLFLISLASAIPMAAYGWISIDGEPAPIDTEIRIWDGENWVWIQCGEDDYTMHLTNIEGWYGHTEPCGGFIFGGGGEIYVNGEPTGQIIVWEEGEVIKLNIDAGHPKLNPASWDLYAIHGDGSPDSDCSIYLYKPPFDEIMYDGGHGGTDPPWDDGYFYDHNFMPGEYIFEVCGYRHDISLDSGQSIEITLNTDTGEWWVAEIDNRLGNLEGIFVICLVVLIIIKLVR